MGVIQGMPQRQQNAPAAPMELKTTRAADGAMTNHVPGAPAGGFMDPRALFDALINKRLQGRGAPAGPDEGSAAPRAGAAAAPRSSGGGGSSYSPQMGTAPVKPAAITRRVNDPNASPYHQFQHGAPPPMVLERYIPGVGWEFDGVQGRGSGGGQGRIDTQAEPSGGYSSGGGSPAFDPRLAALTAQQEAARPNVMPIGGVSRQQQREADERAALELKVPRPATIPSFQGRG